MSVRRLLVLLLWVHNTASSSRTWVILMCKPDIPCKTKLQLERRDEVLNQKSTCCIETRKVCRLSFHMGYNVSRLLVGVSCLN